MLATGKRWRREYLTHMSSLNPHRNVRQCSLHFTDRAPGLRALKGITDLAFQLRLTPIDATFSIFKCLIMKGDILKD